MVIGRQVRANQGVEELLSNLADYPKIKKLTFSTKKLDSWDSFFMSQLILIIDFAKNKKITVDITIPSKRYSRAPSACLFCSRKGWGKKTKEKNILD